VPLGLGGYSTSTAYLLTSLPPDFFTNPPVLQAGFLFLAFRNFFSNKPRKCELARIVHRPIGLLLRFSEYGYAPLIRLIDKIEFLHGVKQVSQKNSASGTVDFVRSIWCK